MQDLIATLNAIQNQKTMAIRAEVNRQVDPILLEANILMLGLLTAQLDLIPMGC